MLRPFLGQQWSHASMQLSWQSMGWIAVPSRTFSQERWCSVEIEQLCEAALGPCQGYPKTVLGVYGGLLSPNVFLLWSPAPVHPIASHPQAPILCFQSPPAHFFQSTGPMEPIPSWDLCKMIRPSARRVGLGLAGPHHGCCPQVEAEEDKILLSILVLPTS